MNLPRWKITELQTRYSLEPSLRDVFVEGIFDKELIDLCYDQFADSRRITYAIHSLEIDQNVLDRHGLTSGNKQRVIALCRELAVEDHQSVACFVDRDLDHWLGELEIRPGLIWSDFCDLEACFFDDMTIKSLVIDASRCRIDDWDCFYSSLTQVLTIIYSIRLSVIESRLRIPLIDVTKCLSTRNSGIQIDISDFVFRSLNGRAHQDEIKKIEISSGEWLEKFKSEDHRLTVRYGYEFIDDILVLMGHKDFILRL